MLLCSPGRRRNHCRQLHNPQPHPGWLCHLQQQQARLRQALSTLKVHQEHQQQVDFSVHCCNQVLGHPEQSVACPHHCKRKKRYVQPLGRVTVLKASALPCHFVPALAEEICMSCSLPVKVQPPNEILPVWAGGNCAAACLLRCAATRSEPASVCREQSCGCLCCRASLI